VSCQELLAAAGYRQYEVSAYAQPARQCRHNLNYWKFGDYLGIGAGAHGKLTDASGGGVIRTERVRQPGRYMAALQPEDRVVQQRTVADSDLPFEFCMNALRLIEGFDEPAFEAGTGRPWATVSGVAAARERGLLERTAAGHWAATARGRLFLNDLQAMFLPDPPRPSRGTVPGA
jgi:oxygen-independent coproporphyrinogen-3 oxidase